MEIVDKSLIKILIEGPEVSLKGSPTVSPTTAALCASDPLPPYWPVSMCFFALSQAPPLLAIIIARTNPLAAAPESIATTASNPKRTATKMGAAMAIIPE